MLHTSDDVLLNDTIVALSMMRMTSKCRPNVILHHQILPDCPPLKRLRGTEHCQAAGIVPWKVVNSRELLKSPTEIRSLVEEVYVTVSVNVGYQGYWIVNHRTKFYEGRWVMRSLVRLPRA